MPVQYYKMSMYISSISLAVLLLVFTLNVGRKLSGNEGNVIKKTGLVTSASALESVMHGHCSKLNPVIIKLCFENGKMF